MKTLKIMLPILFALVLLTGCNKSKEEMDKEYREANKKVDQGQFSEAFSMFEDLAEDGHIPSQKALAVMYIAGLGVDRDYDKAKEWLEKAADEGDSEAKSMLRRGEREGLW